MTLRKFVFVVVEGEQKLLQIGLSVFLYIECHVSTGNVFNFGASCSLQQDHLDFQIKCSVAHDWITGLHDTLKWVNDMLLVTVVYVSPGTGVGSQDFLCYVFSTAPTLAAPMTSVV